jgi:hypothetical protein
MASGVSNAGKNLRKNTLFPPFVLKPYKKTPNQGKDFLALNAIKFPFVPNILFFILKS